MKIDIDGFIAWVRQSPRDSVVSRGQFDFSIYVKIKNGKLYFYKSIVRHLSSDACNGTTEREYQPKTAHPVKDRDKLAGFLQGDFRDVYQEFLTSTHVCELANG